MHLDILIFAIIAAFLIYRLNSILGTKNGSERERPNPLNSVDPAAPGAPAASNVVPLPRPVAPLAGVEQLVDAEANKDGRIETGLAEIVAVDPQFEVNSFIAGARYAFELIVTSYAKGDLEALKPLLSPKLFKDFEAGVKAREAEGQTTSLTVHRILKAHIIEAHLGGVMAYITVDYDVEETMVTKDRDGNVVDGNDDRIFNVEDIWTFTRDTRAHDPNWILIETRAVEK